MKEKRYRCVLTGAKSEPKPDHLVFKLVDDKLVVERDGELVVWPAALELHVKGKPGRLIDKLTELAVDESNSEKKD